MTQRDDVGEAIVHVREYRGEDQVALEYWARMLAAEVDASRARLAALEAELAKVKGYQRELAERCYRKDLELDQLRSTAWADD